MSAELPEGTYKDAQEKADLRARIAALEAELAAARKDAERYRWLREHGPSYSGSVVGTGSMSLGRGPFIYLVVPSHNTGSNLILTGDAADNIIDAALGKGEVG